MTMEKPFAITLDPGSSLANKTGTWRTERPVYVDRLPPCNAQCPAGEDIQGWLFHAESGDYEAAWRHLTRDNPCRRSWAASATTPAKAPATAASSTRRSASTRSSASSATRRSSARLALRAPAARKRQARAGRRRRALGLSAAYHLRRLGHASPSEAGPLAGGMMRFGIPKYRLPRDVLDAEVQRIVDMGVTIRAEHQGRRHRAPWDGGFDAAFLAVGAHIGKRTYIPAKDGRASSMRCRCCAAWKAKTADARPPRGRLRRRQHRHRRGAHRQAAGRHRGDHRLPPHAREDAGARLRGRGGAEEGVMVKWLSTIKQAGEGGAHHREDGARRQGLPAADRRVRDAGGRFAGAGAGPGRRPLAARRRAGAGGRDGVVQVDPAT
jgi:hypothetical protein